MSDAQKTTPSLRTTMNDSLMEKTDKHSRSSSPSPTSSKSQNRVNKRHAPESSRKSKKTHSTPQAPLHNIQKQKQVKYSRHKTQPKQPSPKGTRITATHILFWSGPLSNWHMSGYFSGSRALEILLPRLDEADIDYPSLSTLSTKLLARHNFNCGEQFMMACKGWLFERDRNLETNLAGLSAEEVELFCEQVMNLQQEQSRRTRRKGRTETPTAALSQNTSISIDPKRLQQANITILAVLSTNDPKTQKSLGRKTQNFSEAVWTPASTHVVVAACIARAGIDSELRQLYVFAGNTSPAPVSADVKANDTDELTSKRRRTFVEGSPLDCVWGVGLKWDDPKCDDEERWNGENRLGKCHDEAARIVREEGVGQEW